jgi:WD40 repeat protein
LASSDGTGIVRVWDVRTGKLSGTFIGHSDRTWCVAFSPRDDTLATSSADKTVRLWDPPLTLANTKLEALTPNVLALAFATDEMLLACGLLGSETPGVARVWEAYTGEHLADFHEGSVVRNCRGNREILLPQNSRERSQSLEVESRLRQAHGR